MSGSGIVAVAEASRENENASFIHVALGNEVNEGPALRRCSFQVRVNSITMPPDMDKEKQLDGIRVVDESSEEEVVRLDVPDPRSVARKEPSKEELALPNMMGNADEDDVPVILGPENEWLVAAEAKEVTSVPMGWFVLLFIVLGGVLLWAFSQSGKANQTGKFDSSAASSLDADGNALVTQSLRIDEEAQLIAEAAKDYEEMENVLRGFFEAKTIDERLKFVRHPKRVKPFMEDHYRRYPLKPYEYVEAKQYTIIPLENRPFVALSASVASGGNFPVLLENTGEGYLVDWESFVSYQPITFAELLEKRPTESVDMRVYGTLEDFYAYEFTEDLGYLCVRMTAKGTDQAIFGYVKKNEPIASELRKHLEAPEGKKKFQPFIFRMRFLPGSKAPRSVLIEKVVSTFWAYPTNPDEE